MRMIILHIMALLAGALIVAGTLYSAVETFVLPRSAPNPLTRFVFLAIRRLFTLRLGQKASYVQRDRVMAFYAPFTLLALLPVWLTLIVTGYAMVFWSIGVPTWAEAVNLSGSSLLTLGFAPINGLGRTTLVFSEASIGLLLVALLIAYLPTMYAAFSRRETAVTLLEVRAGSPPSAVEMIQRYSRIHGLDQLNEQWKAWEIWFADVEESHTSLPALVFFRSPRPDHSWITAAGAVLDAAALALSTVDIPPDAQAALCIRAGYLALRRIADLFGIPYSARPNPHDPTHVTRAEFDEAYTHLVDQAVPVKADRDQAWAAFSGWRVNYDTVLIELARLTMAPESPWTGDRKMGFQPPIFGRRSR
jgi:hypothetical protein